MLKNSVTSLIECNFPDLSPEEKLRIKEMGRPLPDITLTQVSQNRAQNRSFTRHFSRDFYKKNNWTCGCEGTNSLYCFPCLLFYTAIAGIDFNWARKGVKNLHHLPEKARKHETSRGHINASTEFALIGRTNIETQMSSSYRESIVGHNIEVRKNRDILMKIICCVKFCDALQIAYRNRDEKGNPENRDVFRKLIDFTAEFDIVLKEHLHNSTLFQRFSKTMLHKNIGDCIFDVCREEISGRVEKAEFLSLQCDEITDVSNQCQMVNILRYFHEGSTREHFWGFVKLEDKSPTGIKKFIENEIDPLMKKNPHKLIAQTHYDANVMSIGSNSVQAEIKEKYPNAHFIHCYTHELNVIIEKAASQNSSVRIFFINLSAIPAFFSNFCRHCEILQIILNKNLSKVATTTWKYDICTANIVYQNHYKLVDVFEEIEINCDKIAASMEASRLRKTLEDTEFLYWLTLFDKIMQHVSIFHYRLQSKNKDFVALQTELQIFLKNIDRIRNETENITTESYYKSDKKRQRADANMRPTIAKEVCDVIAKLMKDRFALGGHLEAAKLFDQEAYSTYTQTFPAKILDTVAEFYPMLTKNHLRSELEVIYSRSDWGNIVGPMNILSFILANYLEETFAETTRLLKIIVTTPMTTPEPECNFTTLGRIKTFLRNTTLNERTNAQAMISINKNLILEIENFDEKVMEKFISMKNCGYDFNFKK